MKAATQQNGGGSSAAATAGEFAKRLRAVLGDNLAAAILYGSAARGQYQSGVSDLNVLVLLHQLDLATLTQCAEPARLWAEAGNPPPLLLSMDEWRRSADVFAIEYTDMEEAHQLLFGSDPFAEVQVRPEHLRLQCERELKSKLIQLREHLLLAGASPEALSQLLQRSLSTFLVLFRALLRLAGEQVPRAHAEVVRVTAARAEFSAEPLLAILRARTGEAALSPRLDDEVVSGYLAAVGQVVRWVDRLDPPPTEAFAVPTQPQSDPSKAL